MELSRREFLKYSVGTTGIVMLCSPKKASASERADNNVKRKAVLVDITKCVGCWWCYAACKHGNNLPETVRPDPGNPPRLNSNVWTTLSTAKKDNEWLFAKRQCMHCEQPACVAACPVGALQKTPEGPVIYDDTKCFGCRYCMVACPFGIPDYEWENPTPWIKKCDFCVERLAEGKKPACVDACTSGALKFGEREALITEARERIAAAPGKYVDHIYGENEVGGTSWLYLSPAPFEELGLPILGSEPVTVDAERAMGAVPPVLLGVAALMSGVYWLVKRREKVNKEKARVK